MSQVELRDRPVFICGHPKSGTSLLRNLLDGHPQLVVYPEETSFFRRYLKEAARLDLEAQLDLAEKHLVHFFEWNQSKPPPHQAGFPDRDYSTIPFAQVVASMREHALGKGLRHPGDVLSAAVFAFGDVTGQTSAGTLRWVEKTPYNEFFTSQIITWWPEALCIHIVRDPRDNYASYSRKHKSWTAEFFSNNWTRSTKAGFINQEQFGLAKYLMIRYETLVQEPAKTIMEVCDFLGIEDSPTLRVPTRNRIPWEGNSMFADTFEAVSSIPTGRWKTALSNTDVSVIETMTDKLMCRLNYTPEVGKPFRVMLRVTWWRIKRSLYTVFRKAHNESALSPIFIEREFDHD